MALSKITTILLLGGVAFKSSALAEGTKSGTVVDVSPTLEYLLDGKKMKESVPKVEYIVDKMVQFKVTRVRDVKQTAVNGLTFLAPFKVVNSGNSKENFVLNINYGDTKSFTFDKTVIYIDKNKNGKLEAFEEVDNNIVKNLSPNSSQLVWLGGVTPKGLPLNKEVHFGLQAKASGGGEASIYLNASRVNNILKENIVFGDADSEGDGFFNNNYINRYVWTIKNSIDLSMKLETNIMSADPLNGVAKTKKEAELGKFFSIPDATYVRSWKIYNNSLVIAKDIHFTIGADNKVEKFAKSSENTWWKRDNRVHVLVSSDNKIIGQGEYNSRKNSVDFSIKELRGGEAIYPHVVTVVK